MDNKTKYSWTNVSGSGGAKYHCGYCGNMVGPSQAYLGVAARINAPQKNVIIYVCPNCTQPTFFDYDGKQVPAPGLGANIDVITDEGIRKLYDEARDCTSVGAYTAAVLLCRKILMNLAIQHGATPGLKFVEYVEYLEKVGYVPPNGKAWVDKIRKRGNEATHEIALMNQADATQIMRFTEMLLRFNYEFQDSTKL